MKMILITTVLPFLLVGKSSFKCWGKVKKNKQGLDKYKSANYAKQAWKMSFAQGLVQRKYNSVPLYMPTLGHATMEA